MELFATALEAPGIADVIIGAAAWIGTWLVKVIVGPRMKGKIPALGIQAIAVTCGVLASELSVAIDGVRGAVDGGLGIAMRQVYKKNKGDK